MAFVINAKLHGMVYRGIKAVEIDNDGHLIFTLTDNSTIDLGVVRNGVGIDNISFKEADDDGNYIYTITMTNGDKFDFTVPHGQQGEPERAKTIASISVKTRTSDGRLFGDINGDGVVNGSDVSVMLNAQVGLGFSRDFDPMVADLNGDGIVSISDMHKLGELVEILDEGQIIAKIIINYDDYSSSVIYAAMDDIVDGKDGYTPIRGKDYWTDADKAEIKSYVDDAILGGAW